MSYTPPAHNAVDFKFQVSGYTPPTHNAVNFNFTNSGGGGGGGGGGLVQPQPVQFVST